MTPHKENSQGEGAAESAGWADLPLDERREAIAELAEEVAQALEMPQ